MLDATILVIFPLCMTIAAMSDMLEMTIPNRTSVILLVSFILIAPLTGMDIWVFGSHILAGLLVFAVVFVLFALNTMGGGDAKILAASAVWFGMNESLTVYFLYTAIFGGMLSVGVLALRSKSDQIMASGLPIPLHFLHGGKIPYGMAIGTAALLTYSQSPLMVLLLAGKL